MHKEEKHCLHKHSRKRTEISRTISLWKNLGDVVLGFLKKHSMSHVAAWLLESSIVPSTAGYNIFKHSDESKQGLRICCLTYKISYRHVDKLVLKYEGMPAVSLSIASISTALTD